MSMSVLAFRCTFIYVQSPCQTEKVAKLRITSGLLVIAFLCRMRQSRASL